MNSPEYERRLVAVLYADVTGYSLLTAADEAGTHRQLSESLDLFADRVTNAGGRVVHYAGDAVLASFDSVVAAVSCAVGIQRASAALRAVYPDEHRIVFRIGVNLAEVIVDRDDIYGDGVNIAARLEGLAVPGGVCVSDAVFGQLEGKLDLRFEDIGEHALKNIARPVRAHRVVLDSELPDDPAQQATLARISAYPAVAAAGSAAAALDDFAAPAPPSIMVLPFKNLGGEPELESLVHGFALSIQSVLVRLPGLFLIGPAAPETYRARTISAAQAGNEVGVRYVLEAVVQVAGDRIRITAQVTDAPAAEIVWADRYDRLRADVFELQDEITTAVVTAIDAKVLRGTLVDMMWWEKLADWRLREPILRGMSHLYRGTAEDNAQARRLFEQIVAEVPDQGQALALLAATHWFDVFRGWSGTPAESVRRATELAEKAIALDADPDGWAHLLLGYVRLYQRRYDEALQLSRHAAVLRASCPMAGGIYGDVLHYCGRPVEAIDVVRKAVRKARVYPPWMVNLLAASYRDAGQLVPSISVVNKALALDAENVDGLAILSSDLSLSGRIDEAREIGRQILRLQPGFSVAGYLESQPYREASARDAVVAALVTAGLPDQSA